MVIRMSEKIIRFKDLSGWLKTAIIGSWCFIGIWTISIITETIILIIEEGI